MSTMDWLLHLPTQIVWMGKGEFWRILCSAATIGMKGRQGEDFSISMDAEL